MAGPVRTAHEVFAMPYRDRSWFHLVLAAVLLLVSSWASAAPNIKDVQAAIKNGEFVRAEGMLKQVVAEHPDKPTPWFYLAQVQVRLEKPGDALASLDRAERLDRTGSFASNPETLKKLRRSIEDRVASSARASARSAPPPVRSVTETRANPVAPPPAVSRPIVPLPPPVSCPAGQVYRGGACITPAPFPWGTVLVVFLVLGGAVGGVVFWVNRRKAQNDADIRQGLLERVVGAQDKAQTVQQELRYQDKSGTPLGHDVDELVEDLAALAAKIRGPDAHLYGIPFGAVEAGVRAASAVERRLRDKQYDRPAEPAPAPVSQPSVRDTPAPQPPRYEREPTPVVVQQGPSALDAIVLSEALRPRERVVERVVERPVYVPAPSFEPAERAAVPDFDFGSGARSAPTAAAVPDFDFGSESAKADTAEAEFDFGRDEDDEPKKTEKTGDGW